MSTYAIGDIQGCDDELAALLHCIAFEAGQDRLILVGDLVNRGPASLAVLRRVRALGTAATALLGNHDLHLLALAHGAQPGRRDTLEAVLAAPDCDELLAWLASRPLVHLHAPSATLLVHAGLAPEWSVMQTLELAEEASQQISGPKAGRFFARMYGDRPDRWDPRLRGVERLRLLVNCLTRLRYVHADGRLDLHHKGAPESAPAGLIPWFQAPARRSRDHHVVFGHWSTLGRIAWPEHRAHGLDTGCVWGGRLTALRLEDGALFSVPGAGHATPD